jgi:hypothetical protein
MVDLKEMTNIAPEERIKLLKKIKELEEEKLIAAEEAKKKEIEDIKQKTKELEDELSEEINESIDELTQNEAAKLKKNESVEERIIKTQQQKQSFTYTGLTDKIASDNVNDQRNAYSIIKEIQKNTESGVDYKTAQKLKTLFDEMQEKNDDFHYVERSKSIINEIFDNIKENYKTDDH